MFVKTSKIMGIVICILIPLVITGFIANYAYNDPDDIMGNKSKWEDYYLEKEYGNTMLEKLTSSIKLRSAYYNTVPVVNHIDEHGRFKLAIFSHVMPNANTVLYTGFIYAIDFTEVDINRAAELKVIYANEDLDLATLEEDDEDRLTASFSTFYEVADSEAEIRPEDLEEDENYEAYAYTFNFYNVSEVGDDNTITFRIDLLDSSSEYKETLFGTESGFKLTNIIKNAKTFENMMNNEGSTITTGLSGDALKFGKGYNAFIWPTVLWISAVALVISGALSYLFYLIWTTEEETTPALPKPTKIKKKK